MSDPLRMTFVMGGNSRPGSRTAPPCTFFKIWQHFPERSALYLRQTLWKTLSFQPQENTSEATSFFKDLDLSPLISSLSQQLLLSLDALLLLFVSAETLCLSYPQHPPGTEHAQGKVDGHHPFTSEWLFSHMWNLSSSSPYRLHSSAMPGKDNCNLSTFLWLLRQEHWPDYILPGGTSRHSSF